MSNLSPNEPSPIQPGTNPPPTMPVLKPLSKEEATASPQTVPASPPAAPAPDAERRAAEAIAMVQSESFRRQVRQQDAEMAGDLNVLMRKPIVARTIVGVLLLVGFVMIRYARMENRAARRAAAEATPTPVFVGQPASAPGGNFSAQPRYAPPPPPQYNPAFDQRLRRPGYPVSNGAPGMPTGPNPAIAPYLDQYGNPRRPEGYPQPGGGDQEIVSEVLRRQEEDLRRRQEGTQPGEPTGQMPDPQAQAQPQWQPPPAFPQSQPAPPQQQQSQPEPGYPQPQGVPAEPVPQPYNPPPAGGENGGFPPR